MAFGRKYVRLNGADSVRAEMRIVGVGTRTVHTKPRKVLLMKLGPDVLGFKTTLWLPPDEDWSLCVAFVMEGIPLDAIGTIVSAAGERHWWHYEVALIPNPVIRTLITRLLNQRLRQRSPVLYRIHETYRRQDHLHNQE